MNAAEHQAEAERLLGQAKKSMNELLDKGSQPVLTLQANQHAIDQLIATAHVHALLAR